MLQDGGRFVWQKRITSEHEHCQSELSTLSRSFRTDSESRKAARRARRNDDRTPRLPRMLARRPAPNASHSLPPRSLRYVLDLVPLEYWHGISRIALIART